MAPSLIHLFQMDETRLNNKQMNLKKVRDLEKKRFDKERCMRCLTEDFFLDLPLLFLLIRVVSYPSGWRRLIR